ncbi:hypothetical protein KAOT1_20767 [Kordia algicida OT-1]|uniref:Uncharacterized protein n=1 Tax=Kordia algicida OT-1 TaxID=391587 RepID=A9DM59_9FLAO|nr:hypothetical protein KAOT1_20767 [Kordia algicida OT-1]
MIQGRFKDEFECYLKLIDTFSNFQIATLIRIASLNSKI